MRKKVLITGATGFIGSFLVEEALAQGYEVYAGVRRSSNKQYLEQLDVNFIELDLSSADALQNRFDTLLESERRFDYVIHNAGITHAKRNESFEKTNFEYTKNIADALVGAGMDVKKFVLVSSLASFGPGDATALQPIKPSDDKRPMSLYGKSKLMAEAYVSSLPALPYLIINPTAVYGPRDKGFLPFFKLIRRGLEPYIGRKNSMTSMVYVKDLGKAIVSLAASETANRSFIISDGNAYRQEELGEVARKLLQKRTLRLRIPLGVVRSTVGAFDRVHNFFVGYPPFLNQEKLDEICQPNWLCDSSDAWQVLNDRPVYTLEDGFRETIEWYRENRWL